MIDASTELAVLAVALGLGLNVILLALYLRQQRAGARRTVELAAQSRIEALERDFAAILSCSCHIGERLGEAERTVRVLRRTLDSLHTKDEGQLDIPQAKKLLANGLSLEDVTRLCELSEGERELLSNMARHRRAA